MKIVDVPPWRAYVCIAFFKDRIEGALISGILCSALKVPTNEKLLTKQLPDFPYTPASEW
jgi:hypothetical protein